MEYSGDRPRRLDGLLSRKPWPELNYRYPIAMFRYLVLFFSLAMLTVTLNSPGSEWPIDFKAFGYHAHGNVLYWLFFASLISFVPLMTIGIILFASDLISFAKDKKSKHIARLLFFSLAIFISLYRFNTWVFSEIF